MTELEKAAERWALEHGCGSNSTEPRSVTILCAEEVAFIAGAGWAIEESAKVAEFYRHRDHEGRELGSMFINTTARKIFSEICALTCRCNNEIATDQANVSPADRDV